MKNVFDLLDKMEDFFPVSSMEIYFSIISYDGNLNERLKGKISF
jgi:hypothetical protein